MIDDSKKNEILKNILQSSEFKNSERYQDILKYLVHASLKKESLKETSIAIDLFGKSTDYNPHEDTTVRVYISNLRKKLEHYYLTDGKDDDIQIRIHKGHYEVDFIPVHQEILKKQNIFKKISLTLLIALIGLLIVLILVIKNQKGDKNSLSFTQNHPVLGQYFQQNQFPTLLVLGDYFFLSKRKSEIKGGYYIRAPRINSLEEFISRLNEDPGFYDQYDVCDFTYLGKGVVECLFKLLPILSSSPNPIELKFASEIKLDDFNTHNIIYIGTYKTLYKFKKLFYNFGFSYNLFPPQIFISDEKGNTGRTLTAAIHDHGENSKDYCTIVKYAEAQGNIILLLTGFDASGVLLAIRNITDPQYIDQIVNLSKPDKSTDPILFESIIEVESADKSILKSEIVYFKRLGISNKLMPK